MVPPAFDISMTRVVYSANDVPFETVDHPVLQAESAGGRNRSLSLASTSSSISVTSPAPSSGNASSSSLYLPASKGIYNDLEPASKRSSFGSSRSQTLYSHEAAEEYVLALHDFVPQQQNATCLSFRAGERIRVLNRDPSGWWDGELDGRRGWFPSNYVNKDIILLTQEEMPQAPRIRRMHRTSRSIVSNASTTSNTKVNGHAHDDSTVEVYLGTNSCPPVMFPLLHSLQLLQNTKQSRRISHYQPSVACIISCIRALLQCTDCLPRDSPLLRRFPRLAQERKRVLSDLAMLVTQAKKASAIYANEEDREPDEEYMLKLAGQVFAQVRRYLAVAVQCGVELPERKFAGDSHPSGYDADDQDRGVYGLGAYSTDDEEYYPPATVNGSTRRESIDDHRGSYDGGRNYTPTSAGSCAPLIESSDAQDVTAFKHEQYIEPALRSRVSTRRFRSAHSAQMSVSSSSSFSSSSSYDSPGTPITPPFPEGPCSSHEVLQALRVTHDNLLSTIAAFIGHVHSHSRSAHASSTGHLYDLVRQVVEIVCRLLTITEAVVQHKDVPILKIAKLEEAKENLYGMASSLADSVKEITTSMPPTMSEEDERRNLLRLATDALKAGAECVAAVKSCLIRSPGLPPLIVVLPASGGTASNDEVDASKRGSGASGGTVMEVVEELVEAEYDDTKLDATVTVTLSLTLSPSIGSSRDLSEEEDMTIQATSPDKLSPEDELAGEDEDLSPDNELDETVEGHEQDFHDVQEHPPSHGSQSPTASLTASDEDSGRTSPVSAPSSGSEPCKPPLRVSVDMSLPQLPRDEEVDYMSPASEVPTDTEATSWDRSQRLQNIRSLEDKLINGDLPSLPNTGDEEGIPLAWALSHDYAPQDVAYNADGNLVGATLAALVEKMTPHDSIMDASFASVFFMTFRLFSTPEELVQILITRFNLDQPAGLSENDLDIWRHRKLIPVRLRVSNFIKLWLETYWRVGTDDLALPLLSEFVRTTMSETFIAAAQRMEDLISIRYNSTQTSSPVSERNRKGDRLRDVGLPNSSPFVSSSEVPRPVMPKTLLASLRSKSFSSIPITDFDALELARQLTILECTLYCAVTPEEMIEMGQPSAPPAVNVKAVSSQSTVITGWVAECILDEHDIKKRTTLVKFFIKVADRCTSLNNFSTPRAILAALDSSTISRLHQTWAGLAQKSRVHLDELRKLADHARNYHEYRTRLRNTAPPAIPFLGLYLTDLTFCREGNHSHRSSPLAPEKKLVNFNKYHKLARIVQDMQRFQVPYNFKKIPEVQEYLRFCFEKSKDHGDLEDLYRRSLLVEPKQPAEPAPSSELKQMFSWGNRSQSAQSAQSSQTTVIS